MAEDIFAQKLQWFKENEKPEVVLLLADSPALTKMLIAWTTTRVTRVEEPPPFNDTSENGVWDWLWANARFSKEELFAKSGLPPHKLEEKLAGLITNRIIYPDGTIHSFVQRYLRQQVVALLDPKAKGRAGAKRGA